MKDKILEMSKFAIIGLISTFVDFVILNLLISFFSITSGFWILPISLTSFTIASINSYFLNKNWTFKVKNNSKKVKFSNFFLISLIGLSINAFVVFIITTYIHPFFDISFILAMLGKMSNIDYIWVNIAKLFATVLSMTWNYLGYKFIVFKKN